MKYKLPDAMVARKDRAIEEFKGHVKHFHDRSEENQILFGTTIIALDFVETTIVNSMLQDKTRLLSGYMSVLGAIEYSNERYAELRKVE